MRKAAAEQAEAGTETLRKGQKRYDRYDYSF